MAKEIEEKNTPKESKKKKSASAKKFVEDTPFEKAVREFGKNTTNHIKKLLDASCL